MAHCQNVTSFFCFQSEHFEVGDKFWQSKAMSGCDVDTGEDEEGDNLFSSDFVGHKVTASCKDITPDTG